MPFKPQTGGQGLNYDPIRELANSGTEFNYRAEIIIRVPKEPKHEGITDEDADRIAEALERRKKRRGG